MSGNIRYPNINAPSEREQLGQVKSYLYQLADQLNLALREVEKAGVTGAAVNRAPAQEGQRVNLQSLKSLIVNSGTVMEACSQEVAKRLEGQYVAQSEFGMYSRQTSQQLTANSQGIKSVLSELQQIVSQMEGMEHSVIGVTAHLKAGLLEYDAEGMPVYGVEIGQRSQRDGVEVFSKYARFTPDRLGFYDQNGVEVAYISDRKLFITHVQITGTFLKGRFEEKIRSDGSIVTRWV